MVSGYVEKKIVGYCRVSTLKQKKKGYGIAIQIREIKKFAGDNNLLIDEIYKDEAVSGIKENRKELNIMLGLCKKDKVKAVIFPSTERTARTVRISENLYYELNKHNVRIYFSDMPYYDPSNSGDVMLWQIKEVIAEGNRNAIIERLKKGREERARKGKPAGGTAPYGYERQNKELVIKQIEAEIVWVIYAQAKLEQKCQQIADYLNKHGYHRRNGKDWTQRQVWAILYREELYQRGVVKYGSIKGENKKLIIISNN